MKLHATLSKKLITLVWLCAGFALILMLIYFLIAERMNYAGNRDIITDYRMIARSIKFGILLVLLTYTVFFLYEVLHQLRIHPVQYLFVGAALTIFYLLLLSFAEKTGFTTAYLIASLACIGQICWYLQYILGRGKDILLVGSLLTTGYGVMYILLSLADYSLLVGTLLLFTALTTLMYLTRHVQWYELDKDEPH